MISKIELNQIEWITNGERASALNMNRPLKQFMTKYNMVIDEFNYIINNGVLQEPGRHVNISTGSSNIMDSYLGYYLVRNNSISVESNLPIGWNCYIVSENNDITIDLVNDTTIETGSNTFTIPTGRTAKLVKVTDSKWSVSIERLQLTVEDINQ